YRHLLALHSFPTRRSSDLALPGVIVGQAVPFIRQLGSASVGGCGNSGTALAALDDTDRDMAKIYGWHLLSAGIFQAPWSRTDAKDRKSTRLNSSHVSISYA